MTTVIEVSPWHGLLGEAGFLWECLGGESVTWDMCNRPGKDGPPASACVCSCSYRAQSLVERHRCNDRGFYHIALLETEERDSLCLSAQDGMVFGCGYIEFERRSKGAAQTKELKPGRGIPLRGWSASLQA